MRVWIFQTGEPVHTDLGQPRPMRAMNLANALIDQGHRVTIWTSSFFHQEKRHRSHKYETHHVNNLLEIRLIPSRGYKKNIGIERLIDHAQLASNLWSALRRENSKPDVAFIGYPPIEFAFVASRFAIKNSIPYFLDVKDQWPDVFVRSFSSSFQVAVKFLLWPYYFLGKYSIKNASCLVSMTDAFAKWAEEFSGRSDQAQKYVLPLAPVKNSDPTNPDQSRFDLSISNVIPRNYSCKIMFVGNFMQSAFDFRSVIYAAKKANEEQLDWCFLLCGDGDFLKDVVDASGDLPNIFFMGRVDYARLGAIARLCKIGIAPIKNNPDYLLSIPNKLLDYFSFGLPVLTSLKGEAESLISTWNVGTVYSDNIESDLFSKLEVYLNSQELLISSSKNSNLLYLSKFDGQKLYANFTRKLCDYI